MMANCRHDAEAQVTLADSSTQAIARISTALGGNDTPMLYLLGEKYIAALSKLSQSQNAKLVVLPADLQEAVRGIMGKFKGTP
jgi:regulator of protease activity HflC (stomatin/prohibitin superfamily)